MNKYEAMFIIRPDLSDEEKKALFAQISDVVTKNSATVVTAAVWTERKKLYFPIKKYLEGTYYLLSLDSGPGAIKEMRHAYKLNENILRVLITRL